MSDSDLMRRVDAMQACQVGPPDEWSKATKDGYNQAATDCARNILRIEPVANPTHAQIMADPRVKALVEGAKWAKSVLAGLPMDESTTAEMDSLITALTSLEPKP